MGKEKNSQLNKKENITVNLEEIKDDKKDNSQMDSENRKPTEFEVIMPSKNVVIVQETYESDTFDSFVQNVIVESDESESLGGILTIIPMHFKDFKRLVYSLDDLPEKSNNKNIQNVKSRDLYKDKIFTAGDYCLFINYESRHITIFFLDNLSDDSTIFSSKVVSLQLMLKNVVRVGIQKIHEIFGTDLYAIIVKNNPEWNGKGITQVEYLTILDMISTEFKLNIGKDIDQTHIYIYMERKNWVSPLYGDYLYDSNEEKKPKKKKERKKKKKK